MLLEVLIYGMLAIVPASPNQLDILVLDVSKRESSDGCPLHEHRPVFMFESRDGKCDDPCHPRNAAHRPTARHRSRPIAIPSNLCTCDWQTPTSACSRRRSTKILGARFSASPHRQTTWTNTTSTMPGGSHGYRTPPRMLE